MSQIDRSQYKFNNQVVCDKQLAKVAILLSTFNGQSYLGEQLDSFTKQTYSHWELWASDDGSDDDTLSVLKSYKNTLNNQRVSIIKGPNKGYVSNFLSLVCNDNINADYYAFSDQDDIWEINKLERAVNWLNTIPATIPALYCSRTTLIDAQNCKVGLSTFFKKQPSFNNALVQCIGGGNTMVFNEAARDLLRIVGNDVAIVSHDWWVYIVVSGCGGTVFYDSCPSVLYRQHNSNLAGRNNTWKARFNRIYSLSKGKFKYWNDNNIKALERLSDKLTPKNRQMLDDFSKVRKSRFITRLVKLKRLGIYRQTWLGNLGLFVAAVFGKI